MIDVWGPYCLLIRHWETGELCAYCVISARMSGLEP